MKAIAPEVLEKCIISLLIKSGAPAENAVSIADVFIRASLRGQGHHDIYDLPRRLELYTNGTMNIAATPEVRTEHFGTAAYEGNCAPGELCCSLITNKAIELAQKYGTGFVTVKHSNHFLAAAPYVEMMKDKGMTGFIWSSTDPYMGGPEAHSHVIGNNPMGFTAPGMMFDICMAYSSIGKMRSLEKPIPRHWGRNKSGAYTDSPEEILDSGTFAPMGEHKGFSLALATEAITGGLSGGEIAGDIVPVGGWNKHSQSVLVINPAVFPGADSYEERMQHAYQGIKAKDSTIRIPGENSDTIKQEYTQKGIPLSDALLADLKAWADRLGVEASCFNSTIN